MSNLYIFSNKKKKRKKNYPHQWVYNTVHIQNCYSNHGYYNPIENPFEKPKSTQNPRRHFRCRCHEKESEDSDHIVKDPKSGL